jgi:hypothetical protein
VSGLMVVIFPNMTSFTINESGLQGVAMGPFEMGTISVQLLINERLVQEIECEVVEP